MDELTKTAIKIYAFRRCNDINETEVPKLVQSMKRMRPAEMVFIPDFENPEYSRGLILREYWSTCYLRNELVQGCDLIDDLYILKFEKNKIYHFSWMYRKQCGLPFYTTRWQDIAGEWEDEALVFEEKTADMEETMKVLEEDESAIENAYEQFVFTTTPAQIERELNERVIGQPQLTSATADFLYYHAMRQINPLLPLRPMLVAGPSGTGKTEVWRVAKELYKNVFNIKIIDASRITQEGWKGNDKLSTAIDENIADGGILIADEFDKLARPQYASMGENISLNLQSEFLKAVEGEFSFLSGANGRSRTERDTRKMGFVFLGAFTEMFEANAEKRNKERVAIGFGSSLEKSGQKMVEITDQDYLNYGVMAELIGRIAVKVCTKDLSDDDYIRIVKNPTSRVSQLHTILSMYVDDIPNISERRLKELIAISRGNKTGVRWVCAQIENEILASIHSVGIRKEQSNKIARKSYSPRIPEIGLDKAG